MQPPQLQLAASFKTAKGSVLIVVMLVCIGLVSLTLVFGNSMMLAYRGEDNSQAGQQAEAAIEGAARYAGYLFSQVSREGGMPDPDDFQSDSLPIGNATVWFLGVPSSSDPVDQPTFGLTDEASKLNLNTATQEMLLGLPGMTADLAAAIVNWRTSSATSGTATTVTFSNIAPKKSPFESVEELALLISGTGSRSLLYGADLNLNHILDATEENQPSTLTTTGTAAATSAFSNGFTPGLLEYLTVFSREPNTLSDGTTSRVNVTRTTGTAVTALLAENFGSSRAAQITARLQTAGSVNSVLAFYIRGGLTEAEFETISPKITARSGTYVIGLVNANTASAPVLACIPGIGAAKAELLVNARTQWTDAPASLAWVVPILGDADAIKAGRYLTANSYQLSVDAAAVGRHGRGYRRTRFVIDKSTGTPRIVYRRNLTPLGWALGSNVRQQLAIKQETP